MTRLPSSDALDLTLLRARAADAVDRLLDLLDAIDGDADLEMTATESRGAGFASGSGLTDDDEDGHDAERDDPDCRIAGGAGA